MDSHPIQGRVVILSVASCYRKWVKVCLVWAFGSCATAVFADQFSLMVSEQMPQLGLPQYRLGNDQGKQNFLNVRQVRELYFE